MPDCVMILITIMIMTMKITAIIVDLILFCNFHVDDVCNYDDYYGKKG